jgi:hypothetical protein
MPEQVAELCVRLAELADTEGAVPADGSGIDGVWTTTIAAQNRKNDWKVAMNCDTGTEHTVADFPAEGDSPALRPGSVTVWLGTVPAGVCTPFSGAVVIQETIDGPQHIEAELIDDVETLIEATDVDGDHEKTVAATGSGST